MTSERVRRGRLVPIVSVALLASGLALSAAPAAALPPQNEQGATAPAAPSAIAAAAAVTITDAGFTPISQPIPAGQQVVWVNRGQNSHSVVSDTGAFNSPILAPGGQFPFTFFTAGTYSYHCGIHPFMTGTIVVS